MSIKRLLTISCLSLTLILWPLVTLAHVHLDRSSPSKGESLTQAPQTIELWFSGKVDAEWSKVMVSDNNDNRYDTGEISNGDDPEHLSVVVKPMKSGEYTVKLNVISGDGHRVKGHFSFTVR